MKRKLSNICIPLFQTTFITYTLYLISLFPPFFSSCNKEEPIPAYIHIDKITLSTVYSNEGTNSNKIIDAWIYVDDQLLGAFELPCTVPVLATGSHIVKVAPGVKENGISDTRIVYPFYNRYQETVTLTAGQTTTIHPTTIYSQNADFTWKEDFEGSATGTCDTVNSDTVMQVAHAPTDVFEGTGSGVVVLSGTKTGYVGVSCNAYTLPKTGTDIFLELNYNCNTDFNVGVIGYDPTNGIDFQTVSLTLRPTNGWNKVYVNLTSEVNTAFNSVKFGIFFSMAKNTDLSSSWFYVDNVKLIN